MKLHEIDEDFFICGQIETCHIEALADKGIKTIICNRPDAEGTNQPDFALIAQKAKTYGISAFYLPVTAPVILDETLKTMHTIIKDAAKPIVAYCLSGGRSHYLYQSAMAIANSQSVK